MKAKELKRQLRKLGFYETKRGSKHEKWTNGKYSIAVPRHKEICENTARAILNEAQEYNEEKIT